MNLIVTVTAQCNQVARVQRDPRVIDVVRCQRFDVMNLDSWLDQSLPDAVLAQPTCFG
jgi:hypothetical protein